MTSTRRLLGAAPCARSSPTAQPWRRRAPSRPQSVEAVRGADGIGDPYFPLDGNGGIDVLRYRIHDVYRFGDRHLRGKTRITLRATQDLKTFNLDFLLPVHRVTVDGRNAVYDQASTRHELVIAPRQPLRGRAEGRRGGRATPGSPSATATAASATGWPATRRSSP